MSVLAIMGIVFGSWFAMSLIMTLFLPWIQKVLDVSASNDDEGYWIVAFSPLTLPVFIVAVMFAAVYGLGQKIFT